MRWFRQQTAETLRNVNLRVLLVLLILLPPAMRGVSGTIEIKTHLSTQLPPDKGAPVCLAGSTKPIGIVSRVDPRQNNSYPSWEVVLHVDDRAAGQLSTDSVVWAEWPTADRNCGQTSGIFLEIDGTSSGSPIAQGAVLKGSVTYLTDLATMVQKSRWQRLIEWGEIDIGVG